MASAVNMPTTDSAVWTRTLLNTLLLQQSLILTLVCHVSCYRSYKVVQHPLEIHSSQTKTMLKQAVPTSNWYKRACRVHIISS